MPTIRRRRPPFCATRPRSASSAARSSGEKIYDFNHAVERVVAGVEMARSLPVPFTFVARAENLIRGRPDLDDTIRRLQAFEKAGADVLYAPGLRDLATMKLVASSVGKPINVVMSAADPALSATEMESVGVKRLSVGGALSRLALAAFMKGAREMKENGGFTWMNDTMSSRELKAVFRG
jgi:2-methylisocitrate lyase-like PEP mutase family enzyme